MNIMQFGCPAFTVQPSAGVSKTDMDPRTWVGVNLGRSPVTPGAYQIWVPCTGRVVLTSDAYFMESEFPRRSRDPPPRRL